jgi:hypothetical protein
MKVSTIMTAIAMSMLAATAHAQAATKPRTTPAVLHIDNTVRPTKFTGKCPATLRWTAHLTVRNPPVKVQYQWLRSDSAKGPLTEILIRGTEGIIGGESWQLGGDKEHLVVWERIQVLSPNLVYSRAAAANVTCR